MFGNNDLYITEEDLFGNGDPENEVFMSDSDFFLSDQDLEIPDDIAIDLTLLDEGSLFAFYESKKRYRSHNWREDGF